MAFSDIFRINEFKTHIRKLKRTQNHLQTAIENLDRENRQLQQHLNFKLSVAQMTPFQLNQLIQKKQNVLNQLDYQINSLSQQASSSQSDVNYLHAKRDELQSEVGDLQSEADMSAYGLYTPHYEFATVLEYKAKLDEIRNQQKTLIQNQQAVFFNRDWTINGSTAAGKKMTKNNVQAILRSFNNECTDAIKKITVNNYQRVEDRIKRSFEQHNKMYEVVQIRLSTEYLSLKIQEAYIALDYRQKQAQEKEALRQQREKEREERKLQQEVQAKQQTINQDIDHYKKAIDELKAKLSSLQGQDFTNAQQNIQQLSDSIVYAEKEKEDLNYRQEHATAGYVYIISNIGSLGKDVIKIGVTRRLDPMERIAELSSASVPFKFDVHALIFSYDAFSLENELHQRFDSCRINKVNNRKEFFKIPIPELKSVLEDYKDLTVDFNEIPEAEEYRETLAIERGE